MYRHVSRLALAALMLLTSFGQGITPRAAQAQSARASLTIHSRFCPPNYDMSDIYNACHETVGDRGVQYTLLGPSPRADIPDDQGTVSFGELLPESYSLFSSFPSETHQAYVYCSSNFMDGFQLELSSNDDGNYLVSLAFDPGEEMTCDWYTSPNADFESERASLTIHTRYCPPDYSDIGFEWRDCLDNVGAQYASFTIDDPLPRFNQTIQGNVTFSWLLPRDYVITAPLELPSRVACSLLDSIGEPFFEQSFAVDDPLTLSLEPGDDVICDWYAYPSSAFYLSADTHTMQAIQCNHVPMRTSDLYWEALPDGCAYFPGAELFAVPTAAGSAFVSSCETDSSGTCEVSARSDFELTVGAQEETIPRGYHVWDLSEVVSYYQVRLMSVFVFVPDITS